MGTNSVSTPDRCLDVAIDVGPLHGHRTGVGVATSGIVDALAARGDVKLLPYLTSFRADVTPGQRKLPLPGIVASHLWSRSDRPRADRWLAGADIVHGTNYVVPPTSLPAVASVYDCWFLAHPELATPVVRRAGEQLRRAVGRGAWLHVSSDATAAAARGLLGTDRVVSIPLGPPALAPYVPTDTRPTMCDPLAGESFVLAIGTEERRKGLPLLVHAFGRLAAQMPATRLALAGARGDDSDAVDRALASLPDEAAARVHRLGPVDEPAKHWLLRHAGALAYPSLDEGFGFPILEAQHAGTPVVATEVGATPEVAGDGAVLVAGRDPERFAEAIIEVLTDGVIRLGKIEAGQRNLIRFSWEATADRLVQLYRTTMEAST